MGQLLSMALSKVVHVLFQFPNVAIRYNLLILASIQEKSMTQSDPFTHDQFQATIEQMHTQREVLLGLVRPLSHTMRSWKPNDSQLNIHEILMHIGTQECAWVSKLGQTISAPSEVTLMRYLHQSREVVLAPFAAAERRAAGGNLCRRVGRAACLAANPHPRAGANRAD
jgi:hypothetical protein